MPTISIGTSCPSGAAGAPVVAAGRRQGGDSVSHQDHGLDQLNPVCHVFMRGMGEGPGAAPGWPSSPRIEALRQQWLDTSDLATQRSLARDLRLQALVDVPFVPLGQGLQATAYRTNLTGVLKGFVLFWNVRKT